MLRADRGGSRLPCSPFSVKPAPLAAYLSHFGERGRGSASTQNQALSALSFLHREVLLGVPPGWIRGIVRAKRPKRLPVVLTRTEVKLRAATGRVQLAGACGLMEVVEL
jgi:hypothetical protein